MSRKQKLWRLGVVCVGLGTFVAVMSVGRNIWWVWLGASISGLGGVLLYYGYTPEQ